MGMGSSTYVLADGLFQDGVQDVEFFVGGDALFSGELFSGWSDVEKVPGVLHLKKNDFYLWSVG